MYEVIPLKNANAEDVAKVLSEVFNGPDGKGDRVAVIAEKKSNAVVVTKASAADLKTIKELVKNAVDVKGVGGGRCWNRDRQGAGGHDPTCSLSVAVPGALLQQRIQLVHQLAEPFQRGVHRPRRGHVHACVP